MADEIEIAQDLLESLEVSLKQMGLNLLKDIGEVMNIPYKELVKKIYGPNGAAGARIKICSSSSLQQQQPLTYCKGIVQHKNNGFFCGCVTQQGSSFCVTHFMKPSVYNTEGSIPLKRLKGEELWMTPQSHVINKETKIVGAIKNGIFYKYRL